MTFRWIIIALFAAASPAAAADEPVQVCDVANLTACRTCPELERALKGQLVDAGETFHGLTRNALFAFFFLDCMPLGESLLKRGANPSEGGMFGSMALSLSNEWPHHNKKTNERWLELLLKYHIRADSKTWLENRTAIQVVQSGEFKPDYPEIWKRLVEATK